MSFVNSIATTKGGSHVTHVTDQARTSLIWQPPPPCRATTFLIWQPPPPDYGATTFLIWQVVERVLEHLKKKHKGLEKILKPSHVKNHLRIFINCLIENPAFDSQATLTSLLLN